MSIIEKSLSAATETEYFASLYVELSLLFLSMLAGFMVVRHAVKPWLLPRGKPCPTTPSTKSSPLKQKTVDGRMGFQRQPPAAQEASILLQQGKVKAAVSLLQQLPETIAGSVPASVARSLLITAMRMPKHDAIIKDLSPLKGKVPSAALDGLLAGAAKKKDVEECRQLDHLSRSLQIPKSQASLEALAQAYSSDASSLRTLVEEADAPLARPFAEIALWACSTMKDYSLASDVLKKASEGDAAYLRSVLGKERAPAQEVSEQELPAKRISSGTLSPTTAGSDASDSPRDSNTSDDSLQKKPSITEPGCSPSASAAPQDHPSYHSLLQARVEAEDQRGAWRLVADMQVNGISPNAVTCTILLKAKPDCVEEVSRVLLLVDAMEEPMDDVFFMALADASIRIRRLDILSKQFEKIQRQGLGGNLSAKTYGTLIKAFGQAHDIKRVWSLWNQMVSYRVAMTSITLGVMVEALVANGLTTEAWRLIQELWKDEDVQPLMNTVIYTSILKGFTSARETVKVMAVYDDLKARCIQPNIITFNTILNAFAQAGTMQHVPSVLEDMKAADPPLEPNIVTYSTLVKGFCNAGNLDRALQLFRDMRGADKCLADEAIYNSLIGGCAKDIRPDAALELLHDMRTSTVAPSNYILSVFVKLMGRCRRLDEASTILEDVSQEYNLKINIQVHTCMIQGLLHNGQAGKALALYDKIISDGEVVPDAMTYTVLVRGCLRLGLTDKATELVRCAHGIGMSTASCAGLNAGCLDEVVAALGGSDSEEVIALLAELRMVAGAGDRRFG